MKTNAEISLTFSLPVKFSKLWRHMFRFFWGSIHYVLNYDILPPPPSLHIPFASIIMLAVDRYLGWYF